MVTVLPKENDWGDTFRTIGSGVAQGYQNRSDENALQKSIADLGPNPKARDVLDAITKTKTYSPESKQNLLKNYLGVSEFETMQQKYNDAQTLARDELTEQKRANEALESHRTSALEVEKQKINKTKKGAHSQASINAGLQTIKEMEDIGSKGNLGIGIGIRKVFSEDARKDSAQYERLGKSLIALASTITIRNQKEFETLSHDLFDPSISDSGRAGILEGMKNILTRALIEHEAGIDAEESSNPKDEKRTGKSQSVGVPEGKIRVKNKATGKTGTVTPYEGMDSKYERI